MVETIA